LQEAFFVTLFKRFHTQGFNLMKITFLRTYFSFSKTERNGLLVMLAILLVIVGINLILPYIIQPRQYDFSEWEEQVAAYQQRLDSIAMEKNRMHLVPFDPNTVTRDELLAMGIPDKPATSWTNYISKGGQFHQPIDIRKVYGLPDSLCNEILPFVQIKEAASFPKQALSHQTKPKESTITMSRLGTTNPIAEVKIPIVDLNLADSARLERLPGIGPVLAGRIVRYRQLLGGYYSEEQLMEVYGLRDEHFKKVMPYLNVTTKGIQPIRINFASVGDLARHPYISYREAKEVVRKREKLGKIGNFDVLGDIFLPEKVEKLHPYIIFAP